MDANEHLVYILKCNDGTFYTGYTNHLKRRLKQHKMGKGAKYTRGRGPFEVVYMKRFSTKQEALKEEYAIKQLSRKEKEQLILMYKEEVKKIEHSKKLPK